MKRCILFLLLIGSVLINSCSKEEISADTYPDFIGNWYTPETVDIFAALYIKADGKDSYIMIDGTEHESAEGDAAISGEENTLTVGSKTFHIDSYPNYDASEGLWFLFLDGIEFRRL